MSPDLYQALYGPASLNHQLFLAVNHATAPLLDFLMPLVSKLGGSWGIYVYLPLLILLSLTSRELLPRRYCLVYAVATLLGILIEEQLKAYFAVPRPAAAIGLEQVRVLGELKLKNSLPSGHAVFAFQSATSLGYRRSWRWQLPLYTIAVLVAYSRLYLGAHYPLDVLAGAVVGSGTAWLVWQGYERLAAKGMFGKGKAEVEISK